MTEHNEIEKSIAEKFHDTGIVYTAGQARLIDYGKTKAYSIDATFAKEGQEVKIPFLRGIGLFDKNDILEPARQGSKQKSLLGKKLTQRHFKPAEIFARACWEATSALEMVVEDYCSEFYEHADSYKGREVHATCIRQYTLLSNLIGREKLEEFASLYSEL